MSIQIDEQYYDNGQIRSRYYYFNNKIHREDGPAFELFHPDGSTAYRIYYLDGERHRLDGPAIERFAPDGRRTDTYYYLTGSGMSEQEHRRRVLLQKLAATHTFGKEVSL